MVKMKIVARQLKPGIRHITAPFPRAFSHRIILSLQSRGLFKNSEAVTDVPGTVCLTRDFSKATTGRDCAPQFAHIAS